MTRTAAPVHITEQAAAATPSSGFVVVYPKTDGRLYYKDDAGVEHALMDLGTAQTVSGLLSLSNGVVNLSHGTSNWLNWGTAGVVAPALTTRSAGTKLVLYNALSGSALDYAIGIQSAAMWFSGNSYLWYGSTPSNVLMTMTGPTGQLAIPTTGSGAGILIGGDTQLYRSAANVLTTPDAFEALTIKAAKRVSTETSSATPTINTDNVDIHKITALATNVTSFTTNLSGTPTDGQELHIVIIGTATRTLAWGASFEASTVPLPTTTVGTDRLDVKFIWNAETSKWRCVAATTTDTNYVTQTYVDATFAPKDLGGVFQSTHAALTGTTPNSLTPTYVQWGTEEAVIAQADCPTSAVVVATLMGALGAGPGSPAVGDRGLVKLQASFDGGSNFADIGVALSVPLFSTTSARRTPFTVVARGTGTVTGDIQVRAMVCDNDQANDSTFAAGAIQVIVHPQ